VRVLIFDADADDYMGSISQEARKLGAERATYVETDRRTAPAEEIEFYKRRPDLLQSQWYAIGSNHRTVDGGAERDIERTGYVVIVYTLDDLVALLKLVPGVTVLHSPETMLKVTW
jgi:hypothetical protein